MSLILLGTAALGIALLLLAIFLRENRGMAIAVAVIGLLMALGSVTLLLLVISQMG